MSQDIVGTPQKGNKNMYEYNVWVPTGEAMMYRVFSDTPLTDEEVKEKFQNQIDNCERYWGEWDDEFYADVSSSEWEVEGSYEVFRE